MADVMRTMWCRTKRLVIAFAILGAAVAAGSQQLIPIEVLVETIGKGTDGTVVEVTVRIEAEDRALVGDRIEMRCTLSSVEEIIEDVSTVVQVVEGGEATVRREWPAGSFELTVMVSGIARPAVGWSTGEVVVPEVDSGSAADRMPKPSVGGVLPDAETLHFLPIPNLSSLEAFHIEVAVPDGTAAVEFFKDSKLVSRRNRAPWSIRVSTREIVHRSRFRAVAVDAYGRFLGEDVIVINAPAGDSGIEILIAPESAPAADAVQVTLAVTDQREIARASLFFDDELIARWEACPCVAVVPKSEIERTRVLAAEVVDRDGDTHVEVGETGAGFRGAVDVEVVELQVQVFDSKNVPVTDLGAEDFEVFERGRRMEVGGVGSVADHSLSLVVAVDSSESMVDSFPEVRSAVAAFAEELLEEGDRAALVRFASDTEVLVSWSTDPAAVGQGLAEVVPGGSTSLHDAVIQSLMELHSLRGRKGLVVLTDGADTSSFASSADARWFARSMRVPLFIVTLAHGDATHYARTRDIPQVRHRHRLATLAGKSGGRAYFRVTVDQLPSVYAEIAEILRSQYVLWYQAQPGAGTDGFRPIRVRVANPKYKVRTISGYYPGQ